MGKFSKQRYYFSESLCFKSISAKLGQIIFEKKKYLQNHNDDPQIERSRSRAAQMDVPRATTLPRRKSSAETSGGLFVKAHEQKKQPQVPKQVSQGPYSETCSTLLTIWVSSV
jgi:hypothetical protein